MNTTWNTGRLYTADGQKMKAAVQEDGTILFADMSRQISGRIARFDATFRDEADFQNYVMFAYDRNEYTSDRASWEYLMMPDKK